MNFFLSLLELRHGRKGALVMLLILIVKLQLARCVLDILLEAVFRFGIFLVNAVELPIESICNTLGRSKLSWDCFFDLSLLEVFGGSITD